MSAVTNGDARSDDRELVIAARDGDRSAREVLGRRIGRSAYLFALQLVGDREAALDVAQDGVVRFLRRLDRFDVDQPIEPWLYQIVRNRVRDLARRDQLRRFESLDALLEKGRPVGAERIGDPVIDAERAELQRRIWGSVSQLSDAHREIFVLRDFHGLSYREIAEALSIPLGTVMSRLHAARTRLRVLLAAERGPDRGAHDERSNP
jgi:RNA polymerase sigma-70 factor (ECF subfamily)